MRNHMNGQVDKYLAEYRIKTRAGEYKWFHDTGSIVKRDSNNKPVKVAGLVIDITKQKEIESALFALQIEKSNLVSQRILIMNEKFKELREQAETILKIISVKIQIFLPANFRK